jgi:hypothetical protein
MILLSVSNDWRDYLNYLEEQFSTIVSLSKLVIEHHHILTIRRLTKVSTQTSRVHN